MYEFNQPPRTPTPPPVVYEDEPTLNKPAKEAARRGGPKWETEARDRLRSAIRKFGKPLNDLLARDANEGDTRLLVTDFSERIRLRSSPRGSSAEPLAP
jgi:hypothetical protein